MIINIFPHLSDTFSMKRYLSGISGALGKYHDVLIYSPVKSDEKISLTSKYLGYLKVARKARSGYNLILSERFTFLLWVLNRKKTFVVCHDLVTLLNPNASFVQKVWYRFLLRLMALSGGIICISQQTRNDLLRFCKFVDEKRIGVVYNGIESFWFDDELKLIDNSPLKEVSGKRFFLMVGTDAWNKNFGAVLRVLKEIKSPDFMLVKVGPIAANHRLELDDAGLENAVINFARLSDAELKYLYRHAVALLFPSVHEGFGWPVLEAMANGCPVIASSESSIPEVGGEAPLYIDPYNPQTIREAMIELLKNENKRQTMIFSGKLQASKFSWDKTASALEALFVETDNK